MTERCTHEPKGPRHRWLRQLEILYFRNIEPTVLTFDEERNVIIGPSGSGKTTLLKLITMAAASNFSGLEREVFGITYELATRDGAIRVAIKTAGIMDGIACPPTRLSELGIPNPMVSTGWMYDIEIIHEGKLAYQVRANSVEARCIRTGDTEEVPIEVVDPFRPNFIGSIIKNVEYLAMDRKWRGVPFDLCVFAHHPPRERCSGRFDEALGAFDAMIGRGAPARTADGIAPPEMSFLFGGGFSNHPRSVPQSNRLSEALTHATIPQIGPEHIPFLARALEVLELPGGEMHLGFVSRLGGPTGFGEERRYDRLGFKFTLHDGASVSHDGLSFGQKRVLSFLFYVASNEDIVLADELSNGLHPAWLTACLESIAPRQFFLTTQSPHLFEHLAFDSAEALARSVIRCRRKGENVAFKPLDTNAAELLFRTAKARAEGTEALRQAKLF